VGNEIKDPGIGTNFNGKTKRIINRDGSYNIKKLGSKRGFRDIFKHMIEISWFRFFATLFLGYIGMNIVFTALYYFCGYEHILGLTAEEKHPLIQTFFFSVQTFTTVGYGTLAPSGFLTQTVATVEAFVGFLSFSLATGMAYGRFSRPNSKIIFSDFVLYSSYQDGMSIKVKMANERDNVLLDISAKMILTIDKTINSVEYVKTYFNLPLEINHLELLPYTWTLVHKIDEESPFWGKNREEISALHPELLVLINGFDETFSQHVHTKQSFILADFKWNKRFLRIFAPNKEGVIEFDINNINQIADDTE